MEVANGLHAFWQSTGLIFLNPGNVAMLILGSMFLILALQKKYEPAVFIPLGFGCILANFPATGMLIPGGILDFIAKGVEQSIFPPLLFLCLGVLTDFGAFWARPGLILYGMVAQLGGLLVFVLAQLFGFSLQEAGLLGILTVLDSPLAIFIAVKLAPHLVGVVAVIAYLYKALFPYLQKLVIKRSITVQEQMVRMERLPQISKSKRVFLPVLLSAVLSLIFPPIAPLAGFFMLGNLFREAKLTEGLSAVLQHEFYTLIVMFLAMGVGTFLNPRDFLTWQTLAVILLGLIAVTTGVVLSILVAKLACKFSGGKINPLLGAAAIPLFPSHAKLLTHCCCEEMPENNLTDQLQAVRCGSIISALAVAGLALALLQ